MNDEIVIRLDIDGFRATINPDNWPNDRCEYRVVEPGRDESDTPLNIDVWAAIEREVVI